MMVKRKSDNNSSLYINVAVLLSGVVLGLLVWFGYSFYTKRYEQAAYKELAESIEEYTKRFDSVVDVKGWSDVEKAFEVAANKHSKSTLYPYFLAYQANALVHQDKLEEAVVVLDKMLSSVKKDHGLYGMYAKKRALIKLDINDSSVQAQGRKELHELSKEKNDE